MRQNLRKFRGRKPFCLDIWVEAEGSTDTNYQLISDYTASCIKRKWQSPPRQVQNFASGSIRGECTIYYTTHHSTNTASYEQFSELSLSLLTNLDHNPRVFPTQQPGLQSTVFPTNQTGSQSTCLPNKPTWITIHCLPNKPTWITIHVSSRHTNLDHNSLSSQHNNLDYNPLSSQQTNLDHNPCVFPTHQPGSQFTVFPTNQLGS